MTDCAAYQRCEPYKTLGRDKSIMLATALIKLIKKYCLRGFAICFSPKHYTVFNEPSLQTNNPYTFSVGMIHSQIQGFLRGAGSAGDISYVFEAGHRHQKQARSVLDRLSEHAEQTGEVFSYSFQRKKDATLLQAADILAWHCNTYINGRIMDRKVRRDFIEILKVPHSIMHFANTYTDGVKCKEDTVIVLDVNPGG